MNQQEYFKETEFLCALFTLCQLSSCFCWICFHPEFYLGYSASMMLRVLAVRSTCSVSLEEALSGHVVFVGPSLVPSVIKITAQAEFGPGMMHLYILHPGCLSENINAEWSSKCQVAFLVPAVTATSKIIQFCWTWLMGYTVLSEPPNRSYFCLASKDKWAENFAITLQKENPRFSQRCIYSVTAKGAVKDGSGASGKKEWNCRQSWQLITSWIQLALQGWGRIG